MSEADRLPPSDLAFEQATLGAMLYDADTCLRVLMTARLSDFYREAHQTIFAAIKTVQEAGSPVDILTVGAELSRQDRLEELGGAEYLMWLRGAYQTTLHVPVYVSGLRDKSTKRTLINLCAEIDAATREDPEDVDGLLTWAGSALMELSREGKGGEVGARPIEEDFDALAGRLRHSLNDAPGVSAARTGMPFLDKLMGGLARQRLVIPRAPTKGLKSIFSAQCALASAVEFHQRNTGQVVACYILEDVETWEERAVAWLGSMDSAWFEPRRTGTPEANAQLEDSLAILKALPIRYTADLRDVDAIALDLRRMAQEEKVGLVLIDHVQRLQGGEGDSITLKAEYQSVAVASLADELHCPIVAPSQLTISDGERKAKWSRSWDENGTLIFDISRGNPGDKREVWQSSSVGRFTLHASRRRAPFAVHEFTVDLPTGQMTDKELGWSG